MVLESNRPGYESRLGHSLDVWPWLRNVAIFNLSFLIFTIGILAISTYKSIIKAKWDQVCKAHNAGTRLESKNCYFEK